MSLSWEKNILCSGQIFVPRVFVPREAQKLSVGWLSFWNEYEEVPSTHKTPKDLSQEGLLNFPNITIAQNEAVFDLVSCTEWLRSLCVEVRGCSSENLTSNNERYSTVGTSAIEEVWINLKEEASYEFSWLTVCPSHIPPCPHPLSSPLSPLWEHSFFSFYSILSSKMNSSQTTTVCNKTSFHENVLFTSHPPTWLMWKKCICFKVWPSLSVTTDGQWIVSGSACWGRCSCENLSNVNTEKMQMTDWHFLFYSVWNIFIGSEVKHKR